MKTMQLVALILTVVGAVNWGLVGVAQFDLVAAMFGGSDAPLSRLVYTLVGVSGVVLAATTATSGSRETRPMTVRT